MKGVGVSREPVKFVDTHNRAILRALGPQGGPEGVAEGGDDDIDLSSEAKEIRDKDRGRRRLCPPGQRHGPSGPLHRSEESRRLLRVARPASGAIPGRPRGSRGQARRGSESKPPTHLWVQSLAEEVAGLALQRPA
jgi:hypothetical protein